MNIAANPMVEASQTIYLKDYQKPSFLVDAVELDIQVYADYTQVGATLKMQRIHRPTVPSALHFLRRSARESESFVQSAL